MCSLCAALAGGSNWTDAAGHDSFREFGGKLTRRSERERRVTLLNLALRAKAISVKDWGGNSFVLEDDVGQRRNVYNLAGLWADVEQMVGEPLDPLAADVLAALDSPAAEARP